MPDPNDLTSREMEVLALAWQCMESEPKIDNNRLAELTGYTPGSASVTLGKIKRKLKLRAVGSTGAPTTPKKAGVNAGGQLKTPKSGKRGQQAPANEDNDEEFATFNVKKEEVTDINHRADVFFQEATAYANTGGDQV
ncbi:hypothetical protein EJ07DRAFT_170669 [Lizonia empirigonia]|nr:hypothetical protein EJ07DRAFT_170669 [Lizonia empirigonia]